MIIWIVECSICGRPFEVESDVRPEAFPPESFLKIPAHMMLGVDGDDLDSMCIGMTRSGVGMGPKSDYTPRRARGVH